MHVESSIAPMEPIKESESAPRVNSPTQSYQRLVAHITQMHHQTQALLPSKRQQDVELLEAPKEKSIL